MTHKIPTYRLDQLRHRISLLSQKAEKLGCEPIGLKLIGEPYFAKDAIGARVEKFQNVEVYGPEPKLNGWHFVAVIQHTQEGNILRTLPDFEAPNCYRNTLPHCDHCHLKRNRVDTYLCRHDDGLFKQIGSSCLKDFLGHGDPAAIASLFEILLTASDYCQDAEIWESDGTGSARFIDLQNFLAYVARSIRVDGWTSAKTVKESYWLHLQPTSGRALSDMFPPKYQDIERVYPADCDTELAQKALAWTREHFETNAAALSDYEWNLRTATRLDYIENRVTGLCASLIPYYQRAQDQEIKQKRQAETSTYFGTRGKREVFTLTLSRVNSFDSQFGTCYLYSFLDPAGNVAVWKTSKPELSETQAGQTFKVKATVKAHEIYRTKTGKMIEQTILTRCDVTTADPHQLQLSA